MSYCFTVLCCLCSNGKIHVLHIHKYIFLRLYYSFSNIVNITCLRFEYLFENYIKLSTLNLLLLSSVLV